MDLYTRELYHVAGGVVSANEKEMLVNGVLATTRGLGNHGDPPLKKCVITEPYTTSVQIDNYAQCVIIASHGVWEVFTDQEAASLIVQVSSYTGNYGWTLKKTCAKSSNLKLHCCNFH